MNRARATDPRVPIAMPAVEIRIDDAGSAQVSIDQEPYAVPAGLRRDDVRRLVQDLADTHGSIRVTLIEANGESFVDIETPRTSRQEPMAAAADLVGRFLPGEEVLVAIVVACRTAGPDGNASLRLPPAMIHRHGSDIVLVGQQSNTITPLPETEGT